MRVEVHIRSDLRSHKTGFQIGRLSSGYRHRRWAIFATGWIDWLRDAEGCRGETRNKYRRARQGCRDSEWSPGHHAQVLGRGLGLVKAIEGLLDCSRDTRGIRARVDRRWWRGILRRWTDMIVDYRGDGRRRMVGSTRSTGVSLEDEAIGLRYCGGQCKRLLIRG